jgi:hypothetical protein
MKPVNLTLMAAAMLLLGCEVKTVLLDTDPTKATYSRDKRTNICFASFGRADGVKAFSVAGVPCTEAVLKLVPEGQRG